MKRLSWAILLTGLSCLAAESPAGKSLLQELEAKLKASLVAVPAAEKLLPAETLGFLTVPDWAQGQTSFSNSATGQLWADPAMKAFKEKFLEKLKAEKIQPLERELGLAFTNFLGLARGQFTLAVVPNGWDGRSDKQPGLLWLLDVKENKAQLQTNLTDLRRKWTESGRKMRTDKIRGVQFTTVMVDAQELGRSLPKITPAPQPAAPDVTTPAAPRNIEWVIGQSGSLLIVSDAARDVEKVLALQSGVAVPALADQAAFAASAPMLRDAQAFVWINVKPIMATLARRPAEQPGTGPSIFGAMPTVEKLLNALGLNGVQTMAFNVQQGAEGSMANVTLRVPESGRKGLFNLLAVEPQDASPPPFIPADAAKFRRWRIDLQKGWTTIENMLMDISPQSAGLTKLILDTAGKDRDPNFDFRKQLLANLGNDVITFEKALRGAAATNGSSAPTLALVASKNAGQLASSLRAVTSIFPQEGIKYVERDFLGHKIYSVVVPPLAWDSQARPLTYAAHGGYVAISSDAATVEEFLRGGAATAQALRDFAGLKDAAQKIGGTGSGFFSFENRSESARAAFATARQDPSALVGLLGAGQFSTVFGALGGDDRSLAELFDVALLPPCDQVAKYFYFNVGAIGVTPEQITFKMFTPLPPPLRK